MVQLTDWQLAVVLIGALLWGVGAGVMISDCIRNRRGTLNVRADYLVAIAVMIVCWWALAGVLLCDWLATKIPPRSP